MVHFLLISLVKIQKQSRTIGYQMIILSPHVNCHLFLMNKIVYCQRKFQFTREVRK
jgi:hypothetical protein